MFQEYASLLLNYSPKPLLVRHHALLILHPTYKENLILTILVFIGIYSQKFDNYKTIKNISKKLKLVYTTPIIIMIILTGLAINTGTSDKFIYFDF